jgi:uncharacterized protein (TIGR00255 family)
MTGYGRGRVEGQWGRLSLEISSVNHRYQEISVRLPRDMSRWEPWFHLKLRPLFNRGKVTCRVEANWGPSSGAGHLNLELMSSIYGEVKRLSSQLGAPLGPVTDLLQVPGVMESPMGFMDEGEAEGILEGLLRMAVEDWNRMRQAEGEYLWGEILRRLGSFRSCVDRISRVWGDRMEMAFRQARERVEEMLAGLGASLDESRWAQELVIMADRWDVSEELSRLGSHVEQFLAVRDLKGPVGKRLDFIVQEMNREVNTLGSKVNDPEIRSLVVDAKSALEAVREQIQNLE